MPFCRNCGNKLSDTAKFCPSCGTKVLQQAEYTPPVQETPVYTPPVTPAPVVPAYEEPVYEETAPLAYEAPAAPAAPISTVPVYAEPEPPACEETAPLVYAEPAAPAPVEPVPQYAPPAAPVFQEPPAPNYAEPQIPDYEETAALTYDEPAAPTYDGPLYATPEDGSEDLLAQLLYQAHQEDAAAQAAPYAPPQEPAYVPPVRNNDPVYYAPTPAPEAPPAPQKVLLFPKKPLSIPRRLLAGLLCVLLLLTSLSATVLGIVRMATTGEALEDIIEGISLSEIPASTIIGDADEDVTMTQWLREELVKLDPAWEDLSEDDLEQFLTDQVKPFIAEAAQDFFGDIYSDRHSASVTRKDVKKLLMDSASYLDSEFSFTLYESQCDEIVTWLTGFGLFGIADMEYLHGEFPGILTAIYWGTSYYAIALLGILALLMIFLLAKTTRSTIRTMGSAGSMLTLAGAVPGVATFLAVLLPQVWTSICGGQPLVSILTAGLLAAGYIITLAVLGAGVLTLVVRRLLLCIRVKQK